MSKISWQLSVFALAVAAGFAQSAGGRPRFEVASVRPSSQDPRVWSMNGDSGGITWTNVSLDTVIRMANGVELELLCSYCVSAPDWLKTERFNITAKFPAGSTPGDLHPMLQNLLVERFKLHAHRATKRISGYVLVIAKGGPRMRESNDEVKAADDGRNGTAPADRGQSHGFPKMDLDRRGFPILVSSPLFPPGSPNAASIVVNGILHTTAVDYSMPELAKMLARFAQAPVVDQTRLNGKYDLHLEFSPTLSTPGGLGGSVPPSATVSDGDTAPELLDAVQMQLGLRLEPKKVPFDVLVVDHMEKVPTEN
jgi:uncharacterized protein (TIGR03435 family)